MPSTIPNFSAHPVAVKRLVCLLTVTLALGVWPLPAGAGEIEDQVEVIEQYRKVPREQQRRERAIRRLGAVGGPRAAAALLPIFEDPFVHLHDHVTSAWIKMLGGPAAAETQSWLAERALRVKNPTARAAAWTALGITGGAEIADLFQAHAKSEKDPTVLRAMARAALRLRDGADLTEVFSERLDVKDGDAVYALALAAARYDGQACAKALAALLKHRDPRGRAGGVAGLAAIGSLTPKQVARLLADGDDAPRIALSEALVLSDAGVAWAGDGEVAWRTLLEDMSWRVRAAAIQAGLRKWDPTIVEPLITRLAQETGRLREDAWRALQTFTGQDLSPDPDLWSAWWRSNQERFTSLERPRPDVQGRVPFRAAAEAPSAERGTTAAFFDLPLYSRKLVFVFDLSGSMKDPASDVGSATKLEILHEEMARTLASLPKDCIFDLLVYRYPSEFPPRPKLTRAFGRLRPASGRWVKKAVGWLAKQKAVGWGAFVEPIAACFEEDVDTVVLLSDGRPSRGLYDRGWRLVQELPRDNHFHQVAVSTVLIGEKKADREFMEELASATGGRFRAADVR